MKLLYSTIIFILALSMSSFALAGELNGAKLWNEAKVDEQRAGAPDYTIETYRLMHLDLAGLKEALRSVPHEQAVNARFSPYILELPLPNGSFGRFSVVESPVMAQELAAKYPEIKTYLAQGIDDPTANARLDVTIWGFHAQIRSVHGTILIDPYNRETTEFYQVYNKADAIRVNEFVCETDGTSQDPEALTLENLKSSSAGIGSQLRTYRLALACTGEYAQFHGGTKPSVLSAMVTAMNRINGIYEVEVGIRMVLIPNNDTLIFLSGSTDPYTNNSGSTMLGQNQSTIDSYIGTANYDIGHVFSTGGGGVASLQSPCKSSSKARGVTGLPSPVGDPFYVDYVAHEMGHQWGGNHTFNGTSGSCSGGNRVASAAYEPGSASTIMGYAGICSSQNIQNNSDPYFHTKNFDEIVAYSQLGTGNSCAVITPTGNTEPVLVPIPDYTIPYLTPFKLTGFGFDPDGDTLTYCWEQYDLGPAGHPNSPNGNAPIFRSFNPVPEPYRYFPRIQNIVTGSQTIGEILPSYGRTLNFRLTARDNRAGGGGVVHNAVTHKVTIIDTGVPFKVASPNTNISWNIGTQETVTWDVASTDISPINSPNVEILLSIDGGYTWTDTLAASVPNNGSAVVTVPNIITNQARVMVKGYGNIFFDISDTDFSIDIGSGEMHVLINDIEMFPNPVNENLNIVLSENFTGKTIVTIMDITGRIVDKEAFNLTGKKQNIKIETTSYPAGLYLVNIKSDNATLSKKFVKQ